MRQLPKVAWQEVPTPGWALTFLIIALAAGLSGFSGLAGAQAGSAGTLFSTFLVLPANVLLPGAFRGRATR